MIFNYFRSERGPPRLLMHGYRSVNILAKEYISFILYCTFLYLYISISLSYLRLSHLSITISIFLHFALSFVNYQEMEVTVPYAQM